MIELLHGDCLERLKELPDCSVDACVTDPPYGLSFMGKAWDYDVPGAEVWREVLRVLKPGGHLLAFAGTRTQHRMAVAIEDAGFEIRDMIAWVYGSGFPKSRNLDGDWQGWGTALKPALEPITVARKPFKGTVAANVLEHGTGALNVDGCRVATDDPLGGGAYATTPTERDQLWGDDAGNSWRRGGAGEFQQPPGRWPANLIHDGSDEVVRLFPQTAPSKASMRGVGLTGADEKVYGKGDPTFDTMRGHNDSGGSAARFFYCAKASKADRGDGNGHPTVKPTELMRYLCRLVTPPGGVVLDPFMGSGSTGKAAALEGFRFIGIEREAEYLEMARGRIQLPEQGALL
jgi:site-specific DNA-methyltransferase (adenine-specific)